MPQVLKTARRTRWPTNDLSGQTFCGPDDCADLVFQL
jgi:hypothetical protein